MAGGVGGKKLGAFSQDEFTVSQATIILQNLAPGKYEFDIGPKGVKVSRVSRRWIQREEVTPEDVVGIPNTNDD